jgi:hypothetical protein
VTIAADDPAPGELAALPPAPDPSKPTPWPVDRVAILIIHGIGGQLPLSTLDQFTRTLAETHEALSGAEVSIQHRFVPKVGDSGRRWYDNALRLTLGTGRPYIDVYECYWANLTPGKAGMAAVWRWLRSVARGGVAFYKEHAEWGKKYHDHSLLFDAKGKLRGWLYGLLLALAWIVLPTLARLRRLFWRALRLVPVLGSLAAAAFRRVDDELDQRFADFVGQVAIYTTDDPKIALYQTRRRILNNAVDAVRFLVEPAGASMGAPTWSYDRVLICGHSLGSQIAFDALNEIVRLTNAGELHGFKPDGCRVSDGKPLGEYIGGLVTFGSPLDKIAFWFQDQTPPEAYLKRQMVSHFHCLKQRPSVAAGSPRFKVPSPFICLLDDIPWRNYFDKRDAVSGALDYYAKVINVECHYADRRFWAFTHSYYWRDQRLFAEIWRHMLAGKERCDPQAQTA